MPISEIAMQIIAALGGRDNIRSCGIRATRLKVIVNDMAAVDMGELAGIHGVLGIFETGRRDIEMVLGPRLVKGVSDFIGLSMGGKPPIKMPAAAVKPAAQAADAPQSDEASILSGMLESIDTDEELLTRSLLVINGPNINLLGIREPEIYGNTSYEQLVKLCERAAEEAGFDACECKQSNHEGELVDWIQQAFGVHDAIVINPAAYTHTSVALLDALKAVQIPAVEVHISAVDEREEFRRISYVRDACIATISGHGLEGYREAILLLARHLDI